MTARPGTRKKAPLKSPVPAPCGKRPSGMQDTPAQIRPSSPPTRLGTSSGPESVVCFSQRISLSKKARRSGMPYFQHRDTVDANAPGEALIHVGIRFPQLPQHVVDAPCRSRGFRANPRPSPKTDLAVLARALNVDLHRRFGEGEEARPEAHRDPRHLEEGLEELLQHPFQIAEVCRAVDHEGPRPDGTSGVWV